MKNSNKEESFVEPSLFIQLISNLAVSALIGMGKMVNPVTGKAQVNIEQAQGTIDLLDMLAQKTKGNLDEQESRMLVDALTSLKLNFVEATASAPKEQKGAAAAAPAPQPAKPAEPVEPTSEKSTVASESAKSEEKHPRYHKTY